MYLFLYNSTQSSVVPRVSKTEPLLLIYLQSSCATAHRPRPALLVSAPRTKSRRPPRDHRRPRVTVISTLCFLKHPSLPREPRFPPPSTPARRPSSRRSGRITLQCSVCVLRKVLVFSSFPSSNRLLPASVSLLLVDDAVS